jgi:excisionase family DNA binding protein
MSQRLLKAAEVAALLSVPEGWVYGEARCGRMPSVSLGRYVRFREDAVLEWIEGLQRGPIPYRKHRPSDAGLA